MCLGSNTAAEASLSMSFGEKGADAVKAYLSEQSARREAGEKTPDEERCGEIGEDGVRRFKHRRVLCQGSEVLVSGWVAIVDSVCMDSSRVTITYVAGGKVECVPLTAVKAGHTDPLNRDLQIHLFPAFNAVFSFVDDMKHYLGTACPVLVR